MDKFKKSLGTSPTSPLDRIFIIKSSTGSGKSTVLPPEFFHRFFESTGRKNICCTQPRVFNATDLPSTILPYHSKQFLKEIGQSSRTPLEMGENIGYQTGSFTKRPYRGIIYMTVGVLQNQMNVMSDENFMKKYSIIFIDETHERSVGTDTVLYMMKKFIYKYSIGKSNKECPILVVMSATFDTEQFSDYLLSVVPKKERYKNIINVKGESHPIIDNYLKYDSTDYNKSVAQTVADIHTQNPGDFMRVESPQKFQTPKKGSNAKKKRKFRITEDKKNPKVFQIYEDKHPRGVGGSEFTFRDILVFVSGAADMRNIKGLLLKLNGTHEFFKKYPIMVLELKGDAVKQQSRDFRNMKADIKTLTVPVKMGNKIAYKKPTRRVIVATNVGETGITYEYLKYVIDTGWHNANEFIPIFNCGSLVRKPVTRGMSIQRRGRTGRLAPGVFYGMYTKESFLALSEDQLPDIIKAESTKEILNLLVKEADPDNKNNELSLQELLDMKDFWAQTRKTKIDLYKIDMMDLPSADGMHSSMEKLYTLGAIDSNSIPTPLGFAMNKFRKIPVESIKMILSGYAWDAPIIDLVTLAAFLESKAPDIMSYKSEPIFNKARENGVFTKFTDNYASMRNELFVADDFIDRIFIFVAFQQAMEQVDSSVHQKIKGGNSIQGESTQAKQWCEDNGILYRGILEIISLRDEIMMSMIKIGFDPFYQQDKSSYNLDGSYESMRDYIKVIKQCIYEGYRLNMAAWHPILGKYVSEKNHLPLAIKSPNLQGITPKYIIYDKIFMRHNVKTNLYDVTVGSISVIN
jgi:HrpA-like RNA helicase